MSKLPTKTQAFQLSLAVGKRTFSDPRHTVYGGLPTFRHNVGENQNGAHCASCEGAQLKKFPKHEIKINIG